MEEILKELYELDKEHFEDKASCIKKRYRKKQTPQKLFAKDILNDKDYLSGYINDKIESLGEEGIIEIINELEE